MPCPVWLILGAALAAASATAVGAAGTPTQAARAVPAPLPDHPGNIFLAGEDVTVPVPAEDGTAWSAIDYDGKIAAEGRTSGGRAAAGRLPVGWYEVRWGEGAGGATAAAVLERLAAPTPTTSPIGCDVAMAWFYGEEKMPAVANLCALAGVNWVRDRLNWAEAEPERGRFAEATKYDASARIQAAAGLRVLQVNHMSPPWANPDRKRFPTDLRDAYRFYREMARRWAGQVLAFEPWNEADIDVFGGHTGAEMTSLQKAACLGLKAGNPDVTACLNVFAAPQRAILRDLDANEAWPWFDTFNLHHYASTDQYPSIYAAFRAASAGRPLWVTEFSRPVPWSGDEKRKEPSAADLKVQAERVAQVFAAALHEGPEAAFYFLLPHYVEGQTQFGIVRPDLTPRPAYAALAAVGRLLADARPLGRVKDAGANVRAFAFRARPDGRERDVVVAWTSDGEAALALPAAAEAVYDLLGRRVAGETERLRLGGAPRIAVLAAGSAAKMALEAPPARPERRAGKPSAVVLQAAWPKDRVALSRSAYRISSERAESVPVFAYNFSDREVEGTLRVEGPAAWRLELPATVRVAPMGKADLALAVDCRGKAPALTETIRVTGDFGAAGRAMLSITVMPEPLRVEGAAALPVPGADEAERWQPMASDGTDLQRAAEGKAIAWSAALGPGDRWVYPMMALGEGERPPADARGVGVALTLVEGEGTFRAVVREENGSGYLLEFAVQPKRGEAVQTVALFEDAVYGAGWSEPDPNGRLDVDRIRSIAVGCNLTTDRVRFRMADLVWLRGAK
jgi:hypothetical protein